MPDLTEQICKLLKLQAGDLVVTEAPFDDETAADLKPINNLASMSLFESTHLSIYTGDYIEPFAHSVKEGFKLPGVRLSSAWEGRHIVYRFSDPVVAGRWAEIARRWALSSTMYDEEKFDKFYPKTFWDDRVSIYKRQFFSLPNAAVSGPATPYNLERESQQLCDGCRTPSLKEFRPESLLRAVKFATRSELFKPISNGLRCTSFVVSAIQAAILHPIVNKFDIKFSFKPLKNLDHAELMKILLIRDWEQTPTGASFRHAYDTRDFTNFFPECFTLDSKYVIPEDIFSRLKHATDWRAVGSYVCFDDKLLFCNRLNVQKGSLLFSQKISPQVSPQASPQSSPKRKPNNKKAPMIRNRSKEKKFTQRSIKKKNERDLDLAFQLDQEKTTERRLSFFATPPRVNGPGSPRLENLTIVGIEGSPRSVSRKLSFDNIG